MTADSTELTFVRCPSCRSLVPAMSTKCRMCGTTLDAAGSKSEESKGPRPQGRVRQRTSTQPDSELSSSAQKLRDADGDPEVDYDDTELGDDDFVDPLSAYVEEVEDKDIAQTEAAPEPKANANGGGTQNGKSATEPKEAVTASPEVEDKVVEPAPRVIVESGFRKAGAQGNKGLSFGKPNEERSTAQASASQPERKPEHRPNHQNEQRNNQQNQQYQNQQNKQGHQHEHNAPQKSQSRSGKLCGWLVSFTGNPLGTSIELREGKFFVSGRQLKPTDLVISHQSVSTPHAIATAGQDGGLAVHDLMSEKGVFIKRKGEQNYKKEDEQFVARSGDSVKFGDAEYTVVLIPK